MHTLSGYDASKIFVSLSFLGCMTKEVCAKLMAIIENRMHSYDESQLRSILNASEALDAEVLGECDGFGFRGRVAVAMEEKALKMKS